MHHRLSRRLATLLVAAVALTAAPVLVPAGAVAAPTAQRSALSTHIGTGTQLARLGGFRSSRRYNRPTYRRTYPTRYRNRGFGRGFFHGLFWGWMLSHFFGFGYGVPLFIPFLLLVFVLVAMRRRRRPPYSPYGSRAW